MAGPLSAPSAPSLSAPSGEDFLAQLLSQKRSPQTRQAYAKDLRDFFRTVAGQEPTLEMVAYFLQLPRGEAVALVLGYKARLLERGLKEATLNRRLSALKALVRLAYTAGKCSYTLEEVKGEKVQVYRDTKGIGRESYRQVLALPERETLKGKRDYAILRLLWDNALRRGEIAAADIGDFDAAAKVLKIRGKGRGTGSEVIDLSRTTAEAIRDWLWARRELALSAPLFVALDASHRGHRLTGEGIYYLVRRYCREAGISKPMSPHRIRHSSITAALDATDGNVRKVQKLSRHATLDTLMVYDDNRQRDQLEISTLLADMV